MSNKSRSEPENVILKCYNLKEKTFFEILLCFVFTVSVSLYTFNLFPFFLLCRFEPHTSTPVGQHQQHPSDGCGQYSQCPQRGDRDLTPRRDLLTGGSGRASLLGRLQ